MPTAHPDPPPATWLASITLAVAGACGIVGSWVKGHLERRTSLQVKAIDHEEKAADGIRADLKALHDQSAAMQSQMDALRQELALSERASIADKKAAAIEAIGLKEEIAHLRGQIEVLQNTVTGLQLSVTERDALVAQLRERLIEKDAEIARLNREIGDLMSIGKTEPVPPKRVKAAEGP